jgi:hypothetical protein
MLEKNKAQNTAQKTKLEVQWAEPVSLTLAAIGNSCF